MVALTDEMVSEGATLIRRLDEEGRPPQAAFWLYVPNVPAWQLVIGDHAHIGDRAAYSAVQTVLLDLSNEITHFSLADVALADLRAPIIQLLSRVIKTGPGINAIRFAGNVIGGVLIEDAYIYRMNLQPATREIVNNVVYN